MLGRQIGGYRILSLLGAGGMGEVYAAEDLRLHRRVALKILPPVLALKPERLQRFEREAQAVAALNHPNVVTLFGVHEANGIHFLTMELVEGKTIADLIPKRGFPVPRFLKIAVLLADAVATAHQRGIIHRDLKPANVIVGADDHVKVLDFGLAKLKHADSDSPNSESETLSAREITAEHPVIGSVPYMSPEQAEGRPLDARSDIFSLGVVFYEMVTGVRPFRGDTALSVISSILKDVPPPPAEVNSALPRDLDRIIRRCLAKDPARRYQSAVDLRNDLEELHLQVESGTALDIARPVVRGGPSRKAFLIAAGSATIVLGSIFAWRAWRSGEREPVEFHAEFTKLTSQPGAEWFPSLSPDGKWVIYSGEGSSSREIYLQSVSGQTPLDLTQDPTADDDQPAFSPEGDRIAFRSSRQGGGIFVMGRTGEAVRRVTHMGYHPTWSPDGTQLAFTGENVEVYPQNMVTAGGLWVVNVKSGELRELYDQDAVLASWSPHNKRIAFTHRLGTPPQASIWTIPPTRGMPTPVINDGATNWNPAWSPDGEYLYFSSDRRGSMNLWRIPIDEDSGKPRGEPEPVTTPAFYLAHPSLSADGHHIVYTSLLITTNIQQLALDSSGRPHGEPAWVTTGSLVRSDPDPSPDGNWVVFYSLLQPQGHLYLVHPDGTGLRQLTTDSAIDRMPRWSPDGKWIACFSNRSGRLEIWKIRPDGSNLQQLTDIGAGYVAWSPDSSHIATEAGIVDSQEKVRTLIFDANRPWQKQTPEVLPREKSTTAHFLATGWSPDGSRLVGQAGLAGGVVTYSLESQTYEHLTDFGEWPVWMPDSRRVMFVAKGKAFYIVDSRTKQVRQIFSVKRDVIGPPQVSRDGRKVFYSRRVTEADIWLLTLK